MKSNLNSYETYEASHIEINLIFELACIENKKNKNNNHYETTLTPVQSHRALISIFPQICILRNKKSI